MKQPIIRERKGVSKIDVPEHWKKMDDYSSHRHLLWLALTKTVGIVVEFGSGFGSTPLIKSYCEWNSREFISLETDPKWAAQFEGTTVIDSFANYVNDDIGLLFIDGKPGEERKERVQQFAPLAKVIVVHDTQESANYVYDMAHILTTFKYRLDFMPDGLPETTAVSNFLDVTKWL
jgi:hypothetical protein